MATSVQATVILWLLLPFFSFLMNKLLSYLDFNLSRKLWELERQIIPSLEKILGDVTEQRMLKGAKDEGKGSESHLQILSELGKDLKSALYDADDILDLVKYRQIEKKVVSGDEKSVSISTSTWQRAQKQIHKLSDLGDKLQECAKDLNIMFWDRLAKLPQYAHPLRAKLMHCAQNQNQKLNNLADKLQECAQDLKMKFWDLLAKLQLCIHQGAAEQPPEVPEVTLDIEQGRSSPSTMPDAPSSSTTNPPTPNALQNQHGSYDEAPTLDAPLNSPLQKIRECFGFVVSWLRSIYLVLRCLQGIKIARDCFGFVFALFCYFYLAVSDLRDWSYNSVGIKNDDDNAATDWVLPIKEIISLRKTLNNIEYILSESNKSCLLNQNSSSSSSTSKDADKESRNSSTVKNSGEEITSTQKEIDDVYRSLKKEVIGRDDDRKRICRMLRKGTDADATSSSTGTSNSVIVIYGITGSGKSTLAQYVCEHEKSAGHFNHVMFVLVGKKFSVRDIFRQMQDQIQEQRPTEELNDQEKQQRPNSDSNAPTSLKTEPKGLKSLKEELEKELQEKRFLLVLDDLWVHADNNKECEILLEVLDAGKSGSRILVTAQRKDAAEGLGSQQQIEIPDLEEEHYVSMLMHYAKVSQDTNKDFETYKAIGRKIMKKLRRSPMAGRTVAARLQSKNSIDEWETVANDDLLNDPMGALWWSYQQLAIDIRRCFAYCSIFPKGYVLKRDELVRIWIAQGFVHTRSNVTEELQDIGQSYFDQLLTFSFLQIKWSFDKSFTIHDLLHELAERVSGSEFFRVGLNGSPEDIPQGVHHLFIETTDAVEIADKLVEVGNLRTLIIKEPFEVLSRSARARKHDSQLEHLFMRLTKLRVLIIEQNGFAQELSVPACIDRMKHLRYLGLRFSSYSVRYLILPSAFSKLYHIETIDIPSERVSCPEDMANLINLLYIPSCLIFPDIGRLMSLRTMKTFKVKEEQGYELKQLKHLNKLGGTLVISGLGIVGSKEEALEAHLTDKERLRKLDLIFDPINRFRREVDAEVLEGLCPPKDLQELHISFYNGSRYPSWMLSCQHPDAPMKLHRLELWRCSQLACIPEGSELFICLRVLQIYNCYWDRLPENMERLKSLQELFIEDCDKIELLPTLPHQALKRISISGCHVLSATCNEVGHENWHKIQHIPEKDVW